MSAPMIFMLGALAGVWWAATGIFRWLTDESGESADSAALMLLGGFVMTNICIVGAILTLGTV